MTMEILKEITLLPLVFSMAIFQGCLLLQRKWKSPLLSPLLITALVVIGVLKLTGYANADYQAGMNTISWLLTPATICLAVPLYEQVQVLRKDLKAILAGILAGTLTSLASVLLLCILFGLDDVLTISLLPKSVTSAMGMALSEQSGGNAAITTAVIGVTGVVGSMVGTPVCKLLKITNPIAQGAAFGTAAHVMGTSRANEISQLTGAVSSLSLTTAGILTAILFPLITALV
jgi:putative effector of murein hydrolase